MNGGGVLQWKPERDSRALPAATSDSFIYDPRSPVPTRGGAVCCDPKIFPWGPIDQRPVEKRRDVLVYTSAPMKQDLEVTGPIRVAAVRFHVGSRHRLHGQAGGCVSEWRSAQSDRWHPARCVIAMDWIRRNWPQPGKVYSLVIDAGVTSNVFLVGHSIRVEISSSNFPRFDRNPNTGRPVRRRDHAQEGAAERSYHSRQYPSQLLLPVIPDVRGTRPGGK